MRLFFYLNIIFSLLLPWDTMASECIDFSGFWAGECIDSSAPGKTDENFLAWEQQDCRVINDGTEPIVIDGGYNSYTWSSDRGVTTRNASYSWNANQTRLLTVLNLLTKPHGNSGDYVSLQSTGTVEILNGRLKIVTRGTLQTKQNGHTLKFPHQLICTYNKVSDI